MPPLITDRRILMALDRLDGRRHTFGLLLSGLIGALTGRLNNLRLLRRRQAVIPIRTPAKEIILPSILENHYLYSALLGPYLEALGIELIHYPALYVPYAWGAPGIRKIVTVHGAGRAALDASLVHPMGWVKKTRTAAMLAECDAIVTVSERSKLDLVTAYGIPASRVQVVYNGVGKEFHPAVNASAVLNRYGVRKPYVLIVSSIKPKKNIVTALRAFAAARARGIREELVLVGYKAEGYVAVDEEISRLGLEEVVKQTGFVEHHEIPAFYAAAAAVMVPSLHEGFGLPLIEAFASGCPVVSSNAYALPEIGGNAAMFCDPLDARRMGEGLECVLRDAGVADSLRDAGYERAKYFTWERAAESLMDLYASVLRPGSPH